MNYKEQLKDIEDVFFDVNSTRYADIKLFSDIFKILDNPDFKKNQPDIHSAELMRIRDLHNSFQTAYEEGVLQGKLMIKEKFIIAKNLLENNVSIEIIIKSTGLTEEEINKLKE